MSLGFFLRRKDGNRSFQTASKEKLFWMDLTDKGRFAYVKEEMFCNNTAFTMSGKSLKYLCAVLNSNMAYWFMRNTALTSGMGTTRWVVFTVETIPIPKIAVDEQRPFIRLVDNHIGGEGGRSGGGYRRMGGED